MQLRVYILGGCCLLITILGQEVTRPQKCGQRWKPQRPPNSYPPHKTEALPNSWPWHVGVYSAALGGYPYCGGTLIALKWVLTAAHCINNVLQCRPVTYGQLFDIYAVTGYDMVVCVADHQYTTNDRPSYNIRVKGVVIHPYFGQGGNGFDMALLQLGREVKRSSRTEYACLPEPGSTLPVGQFCYFAGWGLLPNPPSAPIADPPENLMELQMPIISNSECKRAYPIMNEMQDVCTHGAYGMPCHGDSGGGLHCLNGSKWFVYGNLRFRDRHGIEDRGPSMGTATNVHMPETTQDVTGSTERAHMRAKPKNGTLTDRVNREADDEAQDKHVDSAMIGRTRARKKEWHKAEDSEPECPFSGRRSNYQKCQA